MYNPRSFLALLKQYQEKLWIDENVYDHCSFLALLKQ